MPTGIYKRTEKNTPTCFKRGHKKNKGIPRSEETKNKISIATRGRPSPLKGRPSPLKNIPRSIETKEKISKRNKGKPGWNKGKHHSKEQLEKISGKNSVLWKGGEKLRIGRASAKRRSLGHSFINEPFEDSEGHHLDKDYVLHIPKDIHRSISHNLITGKNMDLINVKALKWIINYLKEDTGDE